MQNNNHTTFIMTPLLKILKETVTACVGIGTGVETQSISEYVLQTTFLKMTGASEQKLKCICWEIATYDYDYRYRYLKKNYGECSSYEDKNFIYKDLIDAIKKINDSFSVSSIFKDIDITDKISDYIDNILIKQAIKNQEKKSGKPMSEENKAKMKVGMKKHYMLKGICQDGIDTIQRTCLIERVNKELISNINTSLLIVWKQHDYLFYEKNWRNMFQPQYAMSELFDANLQNRYKNIVYTHRNRCAHNLLSYQNNLPTLKTLANEEYDYENYFFRFAILILIDEIFMRLYKEYLQSLEKHII